MATGTISNNMKAISGTTLSTLVTAVNGLSEADKCRCSILVNTAVVRYISTTGIFSAFNYNLGAAKFDEYRLSLVSSKFLHITKSDGASAVSQEETVTTWTIYL